MVQHDLTKHHFALKVLLLSANLAILCGCRALENHFVYNPSVIPNGWVKSSDSKVEDAWFVSDDGTQLHGLLARHPSPNAVVLFAHGRNGNVTTLVHSLEAFVDRHQVSVMIFDYRGYGRSAGQPSEGGLYQDARAARKWLANELTMPESEIVLMGRSLGAAVAIELASTDGAKGLIVENGFTSLSELVRHHAPRVPADWILTNDFNSIEKISSYPGPVLVSHGTSDEITPYSQGKQLYNAAGGAKLLKSFYTVEGGKHNWEPEPEYQAMLDHFIETL